LFDRGIKKDKEHYPEFKDEKNWDNFRRTVEATADTHGTLDILDGTFVPTPGNPLALALFQSKNCYMYSVWESKVKTDMGVSFVRSHEVDRDAQAVWRELVAHQTNSTTGRIARQNLMTHLTTYKFDASVWHGTYVSFIVNFQNKLREYERLTPVVDHYSDEMKRTLLMQYVSTIKELNAIKSQLEIEVIQGRPMPTFANYVVLVRSTASLLDQSNMTNRRRQSNVTIPTTPKIMANYHGTEETDKESESYDDAYEINKHSFYDNNVPAYDIDTDMDELAVYHARQEYGIYALIIQVVFHHPTVYLSTVLLGTI
jgi:hypothetical protein